MTKYFIAFTLFLAVGITGCSNESFSLGSVEKGSVKVPKFGVGSFAPDIPYRNQNDLQTTFHKERQPVAILIFANSLTNNDETIRGLKKILDSAKIEDYLTVTIVSPSKNQLNDDQLTNAFKGNYIILLDDEDMIARNAYDAFEGNQVYLINRYNQNSRFHAIEKTRMP